MESIDIAGDDPGAGLGDPRRGAYRASADEPPAEPPPEAPIDIAGWVPAPVADIRIELARDLAAPPRQALMQAITDTLLTDLLEITPASLVVAWHVFAGREGRLSRRIAERLAAHNLVPPEHFAKVGVEYGIIEDRNDELEDLMSRLGKAMTRFGDDPVAGDAIAPAVPVPETADADASAEGERRVVRFADERLDPATMAQLTRAMIERTWEVEAKMIRSEQEARSLRDSLLRARRDAELDYLTGLPNRRAFDELYEREYDAARIRDESLSVAFCDIDHFKRINDGHGHAVGDLVIQQIAAHLKRAAGDNCNVARHGGEEFVLLFRGVDAGAALDQLDRARIDFAGRQLVDRDDAPIGPVTFSGGVADVFAYDTASSALRAADDALYAAKASGRNCIRLAA